MEAITKQMPGDRVFIIRGKDQDCPAWHYILVPENKINELKDHTAGTTIDITQFGRVVKYNDKINIDASASGWGKDPPKKLSKWLETRFGT